MMKRIIAALLSIAMIASMPLLAVAMDESADAEITDVICNCSLAEEIHEEICPQYEVSAEPECNCMLIEDGHEESCPQNEVPVEPMCNCTPVEGMHAENCPEFEASSANPKAGFGWENLKKDKEQFTTEELYVAMFQEITLRGLFNLGNANTDALLGFDANQVQDYENLINTLKEKNSPLSPDEEGALAMLMENVVALKERHEMCPSCGENKEIHAASCEYYTEWIATPFSLNASSRGIVSGSTHADKQLLTDASGNRTIRLEAWTEGSSTVIPSDIVVVLDHSASVYTPIDKSQIWSWGDFQTKADKEKASQFSGYYVAITKYTRSDDKDANGDDIRNGDYCYALVRWNSELDRWERSYLVKISQHEYDNRYINNQIEGTDGNLAIRSQAELNAGAKLKWYPVVSSSVCPFDSESTKFYQSIYGATVDALIAFVNEVKEIPDCRVAFTAFAGTAENGTPGNGSGVYINQELKNRPNVTENDYKNSTFIDTTNTDALEKIITNYIPHFSNTNTESGIHLANRVFYWNPDTDDRKPNRTLVLFTDGVPNEYSADYTYPSTSSVNAHYSAAIYAAQVSKSTYDATVYSVGPETAFRAANEEQRHFLDYISSNYPNAETLENPGTKTRNDCYLIADDAAALEAAFKSFGEKILNASTALSETAIIKDVVTPYFQVTGAEAGTKVYQVPCTGENSDGSSAFASRENWVDITGTVTVAYRENPDRTTTIDVGGFDYEANCVFKDEAKGSKLVIEIPIKERPEFLGGNGVPTNTDDSGIYQANSSTPVVTFPIPSTSVNTAAELTIQGDINIHLGSVFIEVMQNGQLVTGLGVEDLQDTVKVGFGQIPLDLSKANENYGLDPTMSEFVTVSVELYQATSPKMTGDIMDFTWYESPVLAMDDIWWDTPYKLRVTVVPKAKGTCQPAEAEQTAWIRVFYPEITFKDSEAFYYGENPTSAELTSAGASDVKWVNKSISGDETLKYSTDADIKMTYAVKNAKVNGKTVIDTNGVPIVEYICSIAGSIVPKVDAPVEVALNSIGKLTERPDDAYGDLNNYILYKWQECNPRCAQSIAEHSGDVDSPEFYLHPETCTLTITKSGGDAGEPYVFTILKDGKAYTQASITGNDSVSIYELPVGTYSIQEDTGWSWRYNGTEGDAVILSRTNPSGTIGCENSKTEDKWLNGFSTVVQNIFGVAKTPSK